MGVGENFRRYWIAGVIFAVITGTINTLTSIIGAYGLELYPRWVTWMITGPLGVLLFIIVPWVYGRLIEAIYIKFIGD